MAVPRDCRRYNNGPRVVAEEREPEGTPPTMHIRIPHGPDICTFKYDKMAVPRDRPHIGHCPRVVVTKKTGKDDEMAVPRDRPHIGHDPRVVAKETDERKNRWQSLGIANT